MGCTHKDATINNQSLIGCRWAVYFFLSTCIISIGTNYTDANVNSTFNYSTGAGPGQGTLNLNINGSTAGVSTGYYPVHWWTYVIGYGANPTCCNRPRREWWNR
jgi:hypothetical protein